MADDYYVYAIVPPSIHLPQGLSGFGGTLRLIAWRDVAAVVSGHAAGAVEPTPENLRRHERIVEALCERDATLPVRFGTVLANGESLRRALAERHEVLQDDLRRLAGTLEFGVTVLWQRGPGSEPPSHPDERAPDRVNHSPAAERAAGRGAAYLRARWIEHRQAEALRDRAQGLAAELDSALLPHALASLRTLCPSDRLALRDVYLITRESAGAFQEAADTLRKRLTGVRLFVSGPWPPYSFVTPPH